MKIKALSLALLLSVLQMSAYTDVNHIGCTATANHTPGKVEITLEHLPNNMKKHKFVFRVSKGGKKVIIEGHSKKSTDLREKSPSSVEQYRTALVKTIVLEASQIDETVRQQTFGYDDRKKDELKEKSILIQKYVGNTLRITLPTVS